MSKPNAMRIARAIERVKPSTSERRVAYQEAIASANRHGDITNNEAVSLLWLLDNVRVHQTRRRKAKKKYAKQAKKYRSSR